MEVADKATHQQSARKTVAFRYFSDQAFQDFFARAELQAFEEGEKIINEGENSPHLYVIVSGTVNIMVTEGEREVFISALGEGHLFGEAAIFASVRRTASVVSAGSGVILQIERSELLSFIRTRPTEGIKFLMIIIFSLLKKLREANQELAFERKFDVGQDDIDSIVQEIMSET